MKKMTRVVWCRMVALLIALSPAAAIRAQDADPGIPELLPGYVVQKVADTHTGPSRPPAGGRIPVAPLPADGKVVYGVYSSPEGFRDGMIGSKVDFYDGSKGVYIAQPR